jgi:hypothetical protein
MQFRPTASKSQWREVQNCGKAKVQIGDPRQSGVLISGMMTQLESRI